MRALHYLAKAFGPNHLAEWITAGIALGGAIVAIITLRQLIRQTNAAIVSSDAASESAAITRDALYLTEGADVQATGVGWTTELKALNDVPAAMLSVHLKNFGRTAGHSVTVDFTLGIPDTPISRHLPENPPFSMGTGQEGDYGFEPLNKIMAFERINNVLAGREPLMVWGTVSFADIFGRRHIRRYRWKWIIPALGFALIEYEPSVDGQPKANA